MKTEGLIVIGNLSYPNASAPSNRVHLYCKAVKIEKGFPFIINLNRSIVEKRPFQFLARYEGIPFFYTQTNNNGKENYFKRKIKKIKSYIQIYGIIQRLSKNYQIKVLFYNTNITNEFLLYIFLKFKHIGIIRECNESPLFIRNEKKGKYLYTFFYSIRLKLYSGVIVISDFLYEYYSTFLSQRKIFQIPILVDIERFGHPLPIIPNKIKTITYIGSMGDNKDGLPDLIESMSFLKNKYSEFKLQLVGQAAKKEINYLKNKVAVLDLNENVQFLGRKELNEIPEILQRSDVLVLARPSNPQSKAGFPTKLGEYLATGKPVVITRTGEISRFLKDRESAYLVNPGNPQAFSDKILEALSDPQNEKVGRNGFSVAYNNFNYKLYGKKLIEIIKSNN